MEYERVYISPLVLLSVVDHYKRLSSNRVVGILLGTIESSKVKITNSFAVPFEENEENFFLDTSYLQNMYDLYYKVNCAEKILGWYHSGPKLKSSDYDITKSILKYCDTPILAVVNVHLTTKDIPVQVFKLDYNKLSYISVEVGGDETEEVGVEHLLRDIKECTGCSVKDKMLLIKESLEMYKLSLDEIISYLDNIEKGAEPNHKILNMFQEILNAIPSLEENINVENIFIGEMINTTISMNDYERNKMDL